MSSRSYSVTCLARHGIGPDVMAAASRALAATSRLHGFAVDEHHVPFGADAITRFGRAFPVSTRHAILDADAVLVASRSDAALAAVEADLDLRASIVRVRYERRSEVSLLAPLAEDAWAWTLERGFALARESRGRVALVGVDESWRADAAAAELLHDTIDVERMDARTATRALIFDPARFDVVVAPLDLARTLAELAATFADGRTAAWGRLSPTRPSIFGAAHGSADQLAGHDVADPSSMLLAAALMLGEGLGERTAATTLGNAVGLAADVAPPRPSTRGHADVVLAQLPLALTNAEFQPQAPAVA
jgi:isocitrate/isopropylmalate dehydrogenase